MTKFLLALLLGVNMQFLSAQDDFESTSVEIVGTELIDDISSTESLVDVAFSTDSIVGTDSSAVSSTGSQEGASSDSDSDSDDSDDDDDSDDSDTSDGDDSSTDVNSSDDASSDSDSDDTSDNSDNSDTNGSEDSSDSDSDSDSDNDSDSSNNSDYSSSDDVLSQDDEDECADLPQSECAEADSADGDQACGFNTLSGECYSIERRNGEFGSGNFDDGFIAAQEEASDSANSMEALVGVLGGIIGCLLMVVIGGGYYFYNKANKRQLVAAEMIDIQSHRGDAGTMLQMEEDGVELIETGTRS